MGRSRRNPKYLRMLRQRSGYNSAMLMKVTGNPNGQGGYFITDDGRVISTDSIPDAVSKERKQALLKAELFKENFSHTVSECCYIKIVGKHYPWGIKRFFSGPKHFFVKEDFNFRYTSIIYSTKELAMMSFNTGRITWIERASRYAPPPSKSPPVCPG